MLPTCYVTLGFDPLPGHTVSPQSITIKEPEPAVIAFLEVPHTHSPERARAGKLSGLRFICLGVYWQFFGQDLDDNVDVTIEALQAQPDNFLTGEPPFPMTPEGTATVNFSSMRPFSAAGDAAEVERAREPTLGNEATGTALT